MWRRLLVAAAVVVVGGAGVFWYLTQPRLLAEADLPDRRPDLANGREMFVAGGCVSCHAAPDVTDVGDRPELPGGRRLTTPFGTFVAPNISSDRDHGIGDWTALQFVNAMKFGVDDEGKHLYPAFPYTSYQRMKLEDLIDLKAYLDTLPAVATDAPPHELAFPFTLRRGIGLWKLLYVDGKTLDTSGFSDLQRARGFYLVRGPAHCGECHTPRNVFGGPEESRAFAGGPSPEGRGTIPNITPDKATGIGAWSTADIVQALETGFTPDFDSLGGSMAEVVRGTARLQAADREAIAAYLKSLPPLAGAPRSK